MKKVGFTFFLILLGFLSVGYTYTRLEHEITVGELFLVDSKGFIYTDFGENEIRKYSPEGKFLLKIGRKGQGPGDIARLGWFAINPKDGNIYVTEYFRGNRRVSIFSPDGKYIGEWNIELDWKYWDALSVIKFDKYGNGYIMAVKDFSENYKDFILEKEEQKIIKFKPDGKKEKEIYTLKETRSCYKPWRGEITIPFQNWLNFDVWEDMIAIAETAREYINIYNLDGKEIKRVFLPFKKEKLTNKDKEEWMDFLKSDNIFQKFLGSAILKYWKDRIPYPEFKPIIENSHFGIFDKKNNIIVEKYKGYNPEKRLEIAIISLLSGEYLKKELNYKKILFIDKEWLYLSKEGEEGDIIYRCKREEIGI